MKNYLFRILAFAMSLIMLFSFTACGAEEGEEAPDISAQLSSEKLSDGASTENDTYKMYWDGTTDSVVLINKETGVKWSTVPTEHLDTPDDQKSRPVSNWVESALMVYYYDSEFLEKVDDLRSTLKSTNKGTFSATMKGNVITVEYYMQDLNAIIPVDYTLLEDGIRVSIDANKIVEGQNPIYTITLAPFFCSVKTGLEDSYLFYPSGSGALIETTDANVTGGTYLAEVYGADASRKTKDKQTNQKNVYLPVYGVKKGDTGVLGVITSGAEQAALELVVNHANHRYSAISAEFTLRGYDYNEIRGNTTSSETAIYSDDKVKDTTFAIDFYPLEGEDADYVGMAQLYQRKLFGDNKATENLTDSAYSVKFIGGLMEQKNFLGFPYKKLYAATTYNQVTNILKELSSSGVQPNVQLVGFGESGLDVGKVAGGMKLAKEYGSKKDLSALTNYCNENGIDSFFDFNIAAFGQGGKGYSYTFDAAKTANSRSALQYYISKSVQIHDTVNYSAYKLIRRDKLLKITDKLVNKIDKYNIAGVSLGLLGDTAYSDYSKEDYYVRNNMSSDVTGIYNTFKQSGKKIAANGANVYAAIAADCIFETPLKSTESDLFDIDVPFYQIVFKGKKEITSEAVNAGEIIDKKVLQALETGSSMLYTICNNYNSTMTYSPFKGIYGSQYSDNKDVILKYANQYKDVYADISGQTIVDHEFITKDVRVTTYSNGVKIYVNYSNTEYETADGIIAAMGCLEVK